MSIGHDPHCRSIPQNIRGFENSSGPCNCALSDDKETLKMAISLLREWIYELAPLESCEPEKWTKDAIARDYSRLSNNTSNFIKTKGVENGDEIN